MRRAWLFAVVLFGCGEGLTVDLDLVDAETCDPVVVGQVDSVAVEVIGTDDGAECVLARRCVSLSGSGAASSIEDVEEALRQTTQPLIDVEEADAERLAVIGHEHPGCVPGQRRVCGFADLAAASGESLDVPMFCDASAMPQRCPDPQLPFCP